jgi:outer membrane protein insertion porin family
MLAALALASALLAQSPTGPFPVKAVLVKGNRILSSAQVTQAAGILPGQSVRPADMDRAMQKLLTCGYFDRVSYRYEPRDSGYALEWDITEVTVFYPVAFEDLPLNTPAAKQILQQLDPLFGDKIPATQEVLRRYEDALNQAIQPQSPDDRIRAALAPNDKGELLATFRPRRPPPSVYQVDFTGNKLIRSEELRPILAAAATGVIFKESDFRDILDIKIRPLYEARGRLNVSFPSITTAKAPENLGLNVTVAVAEGDEYNLGEIRFSGEEGRAEDWLKIGNFRQGVTANMGEVDAGRRRMELAIKRTGHLDAKVSSRRTLNEQRKTVDIDFSFAPGPRYTFDKLLIQGLDIISEPEIRKIWGLKPAAPFNPEYPDFFLNKIREDGLFDNLGDTKALATIHPSSLTVSVTLIFKGAQPAPGKKNNPRR